MLLGDVVDQFHHVDGLADAGAAEQTDLAALGERADQVDNLDAGFEQFGAGQTVRRTGGGAVNRTPRSPIGPASSIGRPSTSMMRPRVPCRPARRCRRRCCSSSCRDADRRRNPWRWYARRRRRAVAELRRSGQTSAMPFLRRHRVLRASRPWGIASRGNWMSPTAPMH